MLIKLLIVAGLIFLVGRNFMKLGQIQNKKHSPNNNKKNNDDAIDAEYTVVDDK